MNMFRNNSVYLSDEVYWMAKALNKKLCKDAEKPLTVDEFVNGELRDRFTRAHPNLVLGWEAHCDMRQRHKKDYEELEEKSLE